MCSNWPQWTNGRATGMKITTKIIGKQQIKVSAICPDILPCYVHPFCRGIKQIPFTNKNVPKRISACVCQFKQKVQDDNFIVTHHPMCRIHTNAWRLSNFSVITKFFYYFLFFFCLRFISRQWNERNKNIRESVNISCCCHRKTNNGMQLVLAISMPCKNDCVWCRFRKGQQKIVFMCIQFYACVAENIHIQC